MSLVGYAVRALYFEMHVYFLILNEGPPGVGYCPWRGTVDYSCLSRGPHAVQSWAS